MWTRVAPERPRSPWSRRQSATQFSTQPAHEYANCRSRRSVSSSPCQESRPVLARDREWEDIVKRSMVAATAALGLIAWTVAFAHGRGEAGLASEDAGYGLESRAAIGAHHLCSGLWVVGTVYKRTADEVLAQDIAPFKDFSWDERFTYHVDSEHRTVTVSGPGSAPRTARYNGDQGCAILPRGEDQIHFKPIRVQRNLPDAATQPWPTGDK